MSTDPEARRKLMSRFRSKNTAPEIAVRQLLHRAGYRFRLHRRDLPGSPDIVLPRHRLAIFVHGCFWHQHAGCPTARIPTSKPEFWIGKFSRTKERDGQAIAKLEAMGWTVLVIWECETTKVDQMDKILDLVRHVCGRSTA